MCTQRHWWGVSGKPSQLTRAVYLLDLFAGRRVADIGSAAARVQTRAGVAQLCLPRFQRPAEAGRRCSRAPCLECPCAGPPADKAQREMAAAAVAMPLRNFRRTQPLRVRVPVARRAGRK
ncbi:hypothetical protein NDU88_002155 [Pleurodeles waltl]|uniref:Uncharacterized protein n=1 Tax=Pleurodeles waltl TaxID=8319 RepID=A0AAV7NM96_PLEWA|nr:hypothetical protein NDU88_002155 [Pleurodeles waltl]